MSPSADRNRRRLAHSLATLDTREMFDGGWLLPLGQEESLRDFISVYRLLPDERFETLAGEFQPLTVRTLVRNGQTYVYLVNDSPWEVTATLSLDLPADCKLEPLGINPGAAALSRAASGTTWRVMMRPYDLAAGRFSSASARVRSVQVLVPEPARRGLQRRIQDLAARVAVLGNPRAINVLENPSFEASAQDEPIPGWTTAVPAGGAATIDAQQKRGGAQSLKLSSTGQGVSITSAPFEPPSTGRMAVEVSLRTAESPQRPSLRIGLDGQMRDGKFDPLRHHSSRRRAIQRRRMVGLQLPDRQLAERRTHEPPRSA